MLALMVVAFIAIDVCILLVYIIVEGTRGNLGAELRQNDENFRVEVGVRFLAITIQSFLNYTALLNLTIAYCKIVVIILYL